MNLIQKQGFLNSIILYLGTALGFLNLMILFPRFLSLEQIGYLSLVTTISVNYNQLASLGFTSVITRFLPFYKTDDKRHKGFLSFVILACVTGFVIVTIVFILFKELVFLFSEDKQGVSLMTRYYYYIIPISFCTLAFLIQETIARTVFKSIIPAFLREVIIKVSTAIGILLIFFKLIDFGGFINFYLGANILIVLIIVWYNYNIKIYKLSTISPEVRDNAGVMLNYGLFSMISGSAIALIPGLGILILKMLSGESMVGIYSTFFGIAAVISVPAKALYSTSYQIIAESWKNEELAKIGKIYFKTSIIQLIIGTLILIGLIINQRNILYLLHKPEYSNYFNVFVILGCAYLIDITGGLNQAIIGFSKHYKVVVLFLIIGAGLSGVINYLLISKFGLIGAAWSYLLTMFCLNFGYWLYIKLKFSLQPFGRKHFYGLIIGGLCLLVGLNIPHLDNYYLDVIVRSGLVTVVYAFLTFYLKISEDINDLINKVLMKKLR
jgi:O-antigen/teichoic acid export membrane protein